jgi:hypothetical protein
MSPLTLESLWKFQTLLLVSLISIVDHGADACWVGWHAPRTSPGKKGFELVLNASSNQLFARAHSFGHLPFTFWTGSTTKVPNYDMATAAVGDEVRHTQG